MQPYSREQRFDNRFPENADQHSDELSNVYEGPPTAGDVFFELGVMLAASLGLAVVARLLLVAVGAA